MKKKNFSLLLACTCIVLAISCGKAEEKELSEVRYTENEKSTDKTEENEVKKIDEETTKQDAQDLVDEPDEIVEVMVSEAETNTEKSTEPESMQENKDWVADLKVADKASQILVVAAEGSNAVVTMHNKDAEGNWKEIINTSATIGKNGLGKTKEGDNKTPVGVFSFTNAFGIKANPGTSFSYTQVDDSFFWVDDPNSEYYNQFVSTAVVPCDWTSAEHIAAGGSAYNYVLALNYNASCIKGAGSAIFLHCSIGKPTHGCIQIPESVMISVLNNVRPDCLVIIDSTKGVYNY